MVGRIPVVKAQQFGNGVRASLMYRSECYLCGLQIQLASLPAVGKNPLQLLFYLAGGFFAGCRSSFPPA